MARPRCGSSATGTPHWAIGRSAGSPAANRPNVIGDPDLLHTVSYVPDVARALATVARERDAFGEAWHVPNAPTGTLRSVLTMFADALDRELRVQTTPKALMRIIGLGNADVREVIEMFYQWEQPFSVDASKYEARFGNDATPLDIGLDATAAWYRRPNDTS